MSCFVRIATRLTHEETVRQAIEGIGYRVIEGATEARGWNEQHEQADIVIGTRTSYDIGAVKTKTGAFDFVADWSMTGVDREQFLRQLTQKYSYLQVTQQARKLGFVVAKEEVEESGSVRLLLRRFA